MGFLNTTKRGPAVALKFGATRYNTMRDQHGITESGHVLSFGVVHFVGNTVCHFVAYKNGTGGVTFYKAPFHLSVMETRLCYGLQES